MSLCIHKQVLSVIFFVVTLFLLNV